MRRVENVAVRLFVAVWPPEDLLDAIEAIPRPASDAIRWTTRDQWHVTLRFIGESQRSEELASALTSLSGSGPSEATAGPQTVWFPGRRVLHLPISGLGELASSVRAAIDPAGFSEQRPRARSGEGADEHAGGSAPFSGHLTIARAKGRRRIDTSTASELAGSTIEACWRVTSLSLVSSRPHPEGSKYSDVTRVELEGHA